eukprot:gnl/TRDRNA2_/TRDRNA2_155894_c0_seq2.p1 gnl/TRDRNA2_/TRDRNA2_155894_c0~~gnl/TRDRNA2_/TRDRNA2_155894_c0_seq2.p1  ORF type:complete len:399 (-),score=47.65 gnl/TRDRNA2_/TRDRNA2_155894_c0_seq2:116-1312(-)
MMQRTTVIILSTFAAPARTKELSASQPAGTQDKLVERARQARHADRADLDETAHNKEYPASWCCSAAGSVRRLSIGLRSPIFWAPLGRWRPSWGNCVDFSGTVRTARKALVGRSRKFGRAGPRPASADKYAATVTGHPTLTRRQRNANCCNIRVRASAEVPPDITVRPTIVIRSATSSDAQEVTDLVNSAFMADAWFKKPEYVERLTVDGTRAMLEDGSLEGRAVAILVAEEQELGSRAGWPIKIKISSKLIGAVRLDMPVTSAARSVTNIAAAETQNASLVSPAFEAEFGMLSVPTEFGGRGIGSRLVNAAEQFLYKSVKSMMLNSDMTTSNRILRIILPVVNERKDLFDFYSKRGYQSMHNRDERPEDHPDFMEIINDEWRDRVRFQLFYKDLEVS